MFRNYNLIKSDSSVNNIPVLRDIKHSPRPPLPSEFQLYSEMPNTNLSAHSSNKSDTLQRLEVETNSTTSLPISFPYYYIPDHGDSFDTVNFLNKETFSSSGAGNYANTTHQISKPNVTKVNTNESNRHSGESTSSRRQHTLGGLRISGSDENKSAIKEPLNNDPFNPVPKRFSEFITEQQVPYHTNGGESSLNYTSVNSDSEKNFSRVQKKSHSSASTRLKNKRNSRNSPYSEHASYFNNKLGRQISDTMGSQATIFSTRQEHESSNNDLRQRVRWGSTRNTNVYRNSSSTTSTLSRKKAIKDKQGSIMYRIKLRIKKWLQKFRSLKFTKSVGRRGTRNTIKRKPTTNKSIKRKLRANPNNPTMKQLFDISGPVNNPGLGKGSVERVRNLDDELKYEAGAPIDNINLSSQDTEKDRKMNNLSEYIDEQQNIYLDGPNKPQSAPPKNRKSANIDDIEEVSLTGSLASSIPPPVPPHKETIVGDYNDLVQLWKNYLLHVTIKRIQLRQEIHLFQSLMEGQDLNTKRPIGSGNKSDIEVHSDDDKSEMDVCDTATVTGDETASDITSGSSLTGSDSSSDSDKSNPKYSPDITTDKFNRQYQKRQSILGEMLDYDSSDSDLTLTSLTSNNERLPSRENSIANSSIAMGKQYSLKSKPRSLSSASSYNRTPSPLKRSQPYHQNLTSAT